MGDRQDSAVAVLLLPESGVDRERTLRLQNFAN